MSAHAVALIVAGTGEVSKNEVFDLIDDWYNGLEEGTEVTPVVPVTKNEYTDAVDFAVEWYLADEAADPKDVLTVKVEGSNLSRSTSRLGDGSYEEVKEFGEIFKDDFDGFDVVEFFIAMPKPEAEDYEEHVAWIEAATECKAKVVIRDLTAGLDDVVLVEPEVPEAAPEPEPEVKEKPARRSRAKKETPAPETAAEEDTPGDPYHSDADALAAVVNVKSVPPVVFENLHQVRAYLRLTDEAASLFAGEEYAPRRLSVLLTDAIVALEGLAAGEPTEAPAKEDEAAEAPKRGRGRPRENFEVKEIWDEDEETWIVRPRGRLSKGTKWRVRDDRDDSITDEGTTA